MLHIMKRLNDSRLAFFAGGVFCLALTQASATADEPTVFLIEEDWEMVLNDPEPKTNSPQIAFFQYPDSSREDVYFQLQMNYAAEEGYSSGGFRVSAISQDRPSDEERSELTETLSMDGDRLTWTSAMAVYKGKLMFAIKNGQGAQWGEFGGPEYLVEISKGGTNDLSGYDPMKSLASVDVGFGANRVSSIRLRTVRFIYTDGRVKTINVNKMAR